MEFMKIIYFDGVCGLCHFLIKLILAVDHNKKFKFAPLQGESAKENGLSLGENTLIYQKEDGVLHRRSDAVIWILCDFGTLGKLALIFKVIPRWIRDGLYQVISRHRYQFFGRRDQCRLPKEGESDRFLN